MMETQGTSGTSRRNIRESLRAILLIFVPVLVIYVFCLNDLWSTTHALTFLQLDWALFSRHSIALAPADAFSQAFSGASSPTGDEFVYRGYYYAALAPGTAFLTLPFASIGFVLDGGFAGGFGNALLFSEFSIALTNGIATYLVYKVARLFFGERTSYFLAFAYAFSTISWPFATFLFQSDPSAMFDLLAVYFALLIAKSKGAGRVRDWVFCGFSVAAGLAIDYINAILIPILIGYLLFTLLRQRNLESKLKLGINTTLFFLSSFVGVLLIAIYNQIAFNNFFTSSEQLYLGSSTFFGVFGTPLYYGLALNLFSPFRGLLFFCPILILGVAGLVKMIRAPGEVGYDGVFLLAIFCGLVFPYSKWYDITGGISFGPRFLIPSIPFLLIPAGFFIDGARKKWIKATSYALYAIGVFMNGIAGLVTALGSSVPRTGSIWTDSPFFVSTSPTALSTLENFERGVLDTWWNHANIVGNYWWIPAALIIGSALILPIVFRGSKILPVEKPSSKSSAILEKPLM
jgi:hypothetical protein